MNETSVIREIERPRPNREWDAVSNQPAPSWYLDPLVAQQKRAVHRELVARWTRGTHPLSVLKTDLFEEAFGDDHVLFDLGAPGAHAVGMDVSMNTVDHARKHGREGRFSFLVTDARKLAFRADSFDLVFSNSTLDHFDSPAELDLALAELARILRPGGVLIITLDNPWNPLYAPLRWFSRRGATPFPLGATLSSSALAGRLGELGLEVGGKDWLIHNPRMVSTVLFLGLRRLLGARADGPIRAFLALFASLGKLPTRRWTACFLAVCARKPVA